MSFSEWADSLRGAPGSTHDDVTVTMDGRRLDTRERVVEFLAEIEAERAAGISFDELQARFGDRYQQP